MKLLVENPVSLHYVPACKIDKENVQGDIITTQDIRKTEHCNVISRAKPNSVIKWKWAGCGRLNSSVRNKSNK